MKNVTEIVTVTYFSALANTTNMDVVLLTMMKHRKLRNEVNAYQLNYRPCDFLLYEILYKLITTQTFLSFHRN